MRSAETLEVHVRFARLREHPARLLLFLDVVLDHLGQDRDPCVVVFVLRPGAFDDGDELLGAVVLDLGLVVRVLVFRRGEERRVEDFLLDRRVRPERPADLRSKGLLAAGEPRFLEFLEPLLDLAMVGLQQRDGIFRCRHATTATRGRPR